MKKTLILALFAVTTFITGCSGSFSKGDSVVALPAYNEARPGHIEGTVVDTGDGKVTIKITNVHGINYAFRFTEGSAHVFEASDIHSMQEGLIIAKARNDFFNSREVGKFIFKEGRSKEPVSYKEFDLAKFKEMADKGDLKEWSLIIQMAEATSSLQSAFNQVIGSADGFKNIINDDNNVTHLVSAIEQWGSIVSDSNYKLGRQIKEYGYMEEYSLRSRGDKALYRLIYRINHVAKNIIEMTSALSGNKEGHQRLYTALVDAHKAVNDGVQKAAQDNADSFADAMKSAFEAQYSSMARNEYYKGS